MIGVGPAAACNHGPMEFDLAQTRQLSENSFLLVLGQLGLETDEVPVVRRQIILAKLNHRPGLSPG